MIWNWHHGKIPEGKTVDHKDKDPSSNYISNLRLGTRRQQNINTKLRGFHWNKQAQKWVASHKLQGKRIHLGYSTTALQARLAYEEATAELEPEFASAFFTDAFNRLIIEGTA